MSTLNNPSPTSDSPLQQGLQSPIHDAKASDPDRSVPEKPFSIYTKREKWFMVAMVSLAGMFSPFSSAIYFPAIPTMAAAFGKSVELINLTVTIYMVFQGISPMFWGTLADRLGRRPVYLTCLTLLMLSNIGLALVPTNAYWLLMVLRCFQAAGSASTIALGAGVISDIATPAERGGFLGLFALGPMTGPCIAPVIGGLLSGNLGWRSMFWFLCIITGAMVVFMALTFPETLRAIVGDGSRPPQKWNRTPLSILGRKAPKSNDQHSTNAASEPAAKRSPSPLQILRVFTQPDILIVLISTGILYSLFYSVTTTTAPLFQSIYPYLTQSTTGLCFIAYGAGGAIGSVITGRVLDYDWRKMEARYAQLESEPSPANDQPQEGNPSQLEKGAHIGTLMTEAQAKTPRAKPNRQDLPIEHTRLKRVPVIFATVIAASLGYGWSVQGKAHLAVPLVMQFIVGVASMGIMVVNQTILVDMYPAQGSSITASNNFVRCLLGAGTVSFQDFVINAINPGWTYTLFCGICALTVPLFMIEWRYGEKWRRKRTNASK
ncbi:MFS general substrate transporter [Ceratobasidium sp. AG-I]|nr:MFS general substrate transporter [Ceratobasidium sp. AG-I]